MGRPEPLPFFGLGLLAALGILGLHRPETLHQQPQVGGQGEVIGHPLEEGFGRPETAVLDFLFDGVKEPYGFRIQGITVGLDHSPDPGTDQDSSIHLGSGLASH